MTLGPPVGGTVAAVAAFGLAGSCQSLPAGPLDAGGWDALVDTCVGEGLVGLLAAAVDTGALPVVPDQRASLVVPATEAIDRDRAVARATVDVSARLRSAGVDHRMLDGPAVATRVFRDPQRRPHASADVLVAPGAVATARGLLDGAAGLVRVRDEALPSGVGGRVRLADVEGAPVPVTVDGTDLPGLPLDATFVAACARAAGGAPGLLALRDVAQCALDEQLDPALVWDRAAAWRCTAVVAWAVGQAWETFDLADKTELSVWAARYDPAPRSRVAALAHRVARAFQRRQPAEAAP